MEKHWIATYTGRKVTPAAMTADMVCIDDIAHALSLTCRFTGHVRVHYSVAQHSVLVSRICSPGNSLWALLHDAPEAYMADLSRPVKQALREISPAFDAMDSSIMEAVCARFGMGAVQPEEVHLRDSDMLAHEAAYFFAHQPLYAEWQHNDEKYWMSRQEEKRRQLGILIPFSAWSAVEAKTCFLNRFRELTGAA